MTFPEYTIRFQKWLNEQSLIERRFYSLIFCTEIHNSNATIYLSEGWLPAETQDAEEALETAKKRIAFQQQFSRELLKPGVSEWEPFDEITDHEEAANRGKLLLNTFLTSLSSNGMLNLKRNTTAKELVSADYRPEDFYTSLNRFTTSEKSTRLNTAFTDFLLFKPFPSLKPHFLFTRNILQGSFFDTGIFIYDNTSSNLVFLSLVDEN